MLLSIIIPVYNAEKYIMSCIESILCQSFNDYEIILIDDGSVDKSGIICEMYSQKYDNILLKRIENSGVSNARNVGIRMAKGEYIQFIDSDDEVKPYMMEGISKELRSKEYPDLIIYGADIVNSEHKVINNIMPLSEGLSDVKTELKNLNIRSKATLLHYIWNRWYKRDMIISNNILFDTNINLGEDFIFNCEVLQHCMNVCFMREPIYVYYKRSEESLTGKFRNDELFRRRKMFESFCNLYKNYDLYEEYIDKLEILEANIAITSMQSIGFDDCKLAYKEKVKFLKQFMHSEYKKYIYKALKSRSLHRTTRIYANLLIHGMYGVFISALKIRR